MKMAFSKIMKAAFLFLAGLGLLPGCSTAPVKPEIVALGDYEYTKQYISWLITKEMKSKHFVGLSIALVDEQRVVWAEGFGYSDKENGIPATPETVYGVGSISKLFTATAAMQLAEQGKLDIDKPLQTYLPQFSIKSRFPDAGPITLRGIMTHHSGLPSDLRKGMWSKNPEPFTNVVDRVKADYVAYPPNFIFSYSNLGVTLLGHAIQNVSNRDFAAYMEESLLRPMNMSRSGFFVRPDMVPFVAKGYHNSNRVDVALTPDRDVPAGALHSNVLDLSKFMQMVFGHGMSGANPILKPETLAEMLRPQNTSVPLDLDFRIGLGWMLGTSEGIGIHGAGAVADHGGGIPGFRSSLMILPEQKMGVVVLSNSDSADAAVARLAVRTLKLAFEAKTGIKQQEVKKPVTAQGVLSQEDLQSYAGWYSTIAGPVHVTARSGRLEANVMHKKMRLVPLEDGGLGLKYKLLGFIPVSLGELEYLRFSRATVAGREIIKARSIGNREFLEGEKIKSALIPDKWLQRTGEYEITNAGDDFFAPDAVRLWSEDGLLFLRYYLSVPEKIPFMVVLSPVSDTEAVVYGLGRGMGETIRVVTTDGQEKLVYSGYVMGRRVRAVHDMAAESDTAGE
jgi:CubicO group peptidase (beta-lactamase class C family)